MSRECRPRSARALFFGNSDNLRQERLNIRVIANKGHMCKVRARLSALHISCEGVAAASAGKGGAHHVATFAVLEEADACFVKVYVDVADARGGGAVQEVAPSPQGGGLA